MRRWSFASSWIAPVFFAACVVSACQGSAPERHAESASAVEPMSSPEPIDLDGAVWREVAAPYAMHEHTATVLHDGRILVAGGIVGTGQVQETTNASYVFDPVTETWTSPIPMKRSRAGHAAFRNGSQVYVVGGVRRDDQGQEFLDHVEAFYPSLTWFNVVLSPLSRARAQATATALLDGSFLIVGGYDEDGQVPAVDLFNPRSDAPWLPEGRVGHTAVTLPNGSVLVTGGEDAFFNRTSTNFLLSDLENGDWEQAAGLMQARAHHTATVLADGRVVVAGGRGSAYWPTNSVEILAESSEGPPPAASPSPPGPTILTSTSFSVGEGPPMLFERAHHTAGLLPDGRVIVVGGRGMNNALDSTEIYDPETDEWSLGPTLKVARSQHAMVVLPARIIVFGGESDSGSRLASVEILEIGMENGEACSENDECLSGHCVDGVCCDTSCEGACVACAEALKGTGEDGVCEPVVDDTDPRGLCAEGMSCQAGECGLPAGCPECEDLGTEWRLVDVSHEFYGSAATALDDGRVLVTGSSDIDSSLDAFLFTPGPDTQTSLPPMSFEHERHTATKLLDGRILVMGGHPAASELFDPTTSAWTPIRSEGLIDYARYEHVSVLVPDGRVFVIGGFWESLRSSVEVYDPTDGPAGSWSEGPELPAGLADHAVVVLPDGAILVAGSDDASTYVLEPPYDGNWAASASLLEARYFNTATTLPDGRVLVVGGRGYDDYEDIATAEIVDVTSGDVQPAAPMRIARSNHTAGLLPDGRVIVVGGGNELGAVAVTEIYDPATDEWKYGPLLNHPRLQHQMVVLPHHIVVLGGRDDQYVELASVEVLDLLEGLGADCTADAECISGHCVDGVCCDTSCEGACMACAAALKGSGDDGVCATVVDGTNPRSECAEDMSCQAGQCALPSPCAGQADGTECGDGMVCQGGECVAAPAGCENEPDGTICDEGDGCTVGLCRDGACVETYKLDGTRCEGGICIAGECRLDRVASPPSGGDDQGPGSGGEDPSDQDPDGRGASGDADGDDAGGGCSLAPSTSGASTFATSLALLGAIGMLRRRRAAEG